MDEEMQKAVDELNLVKLSGDQMTRIINTVTELAVELRCEVSVTLANKNSAQYTVTVRPWGEDE